MLLSLSGGVDSIVQFLTVLVIFVLVLAVTFFVTRWLGQYQKMQNIGANVEVIEATRISPAAQVEILRVGQRYIAVAVTKENVTYLCDVPDEDIVIRDSKAGYGSFSSILSKAKQNISDKTEKNMDDDQNNE